MVKHKGEDKDNLRQYICTSSTFSNNTVCLTNSKIVYCLVCLFLLLFVCSLFAFYLFVVFSFLWRLGLLLFFVCLFFCFLVSSFFPFFQSVFLCLLFFGGVWGGGTIGRFSFVFFTSVLCRPTTPLFSLVLFLLFLVYLLVYFYFYFIFLLLFLLSLLVSLFTFFSSFLGFV